MELPRPGVDVTEFNPSALRGGGYGIEVLSVSTRDARHRMSVYFNTDALAREGAAVREITDAESRRPA
ncbi:hypothetical protein [Streptomyces sp. URMC 129]|uniref:hypothetical protein n=1 Tax=Streptomyces sp. URMC 129 TaxID=3423407 RepID=UPI003F1B4816